MPSLSVENLSFSYGGEDVLSSVSFSASRAERIAILGSNGSGKTTLRKLIDGLLPLERGNIIINGISMRNRKAAREARKGIGIVFQDPDSQFVSPVLEEDIAFGPENYGYSRKRVEQIVSESLAQTGLQEFRYRIPQTLSGGEKERAQIAGTAALSPSIIILDEAFSMLDEAGRKEMLRLADSIWKDSLLLYITHSADEAVNADRVILLSDGRIAADGQPEDVLSDGNLLEKAGIRPPFAVRMRTLLAERGISIAPVLSRERLLEVLCSLN